MKKRILAGLLSVLMILSMFPVNVFAQGTNTGTVPSEAFTFELVCSEDEIPSTAETVTLDLMVNNNPGFSGTEFAIEFDDEAFSYSGYTTGAVGSGFMGIIPPEEGVTGSPSGFSMFALNDVKTNGVLISVTFNVDKVKAGEYDFVLNLKPRNDSTTSNSVGTELSPVAVSKTITVKTDEPEEADEFTFALEGKDIEATAETVTLDVVISNNPGFSGTEFAIEFDDEAFSYSGYTTGAVGSGFMGIIPPEEGVTGSPSGFSMFALNDVKTNGVLISVTFNVDKVKAGEYDFVLNLKPRNDSTTSNSAGTELSPVAKSCTVTVTGQAPLEEEFDSRVVLNDKLVVYNGQRHTLELERTDLLPENYSVTYVCQGQTALFSGAKDAGKYAITATLSADGYVTKTFNATLTIEPKALSQASSVSAKEYDGTTDIELDVCEITGIVDGDDVEYNVTAATETANAGKNVPVVVTCVLSGKDSGNYTAPVFPTMTVNIEPRTIVVTANGSKMFGKADPVLEPEILSGSLVEGDSFTGSVSRVAGETAGTYAITQGTLTLGNNYVIDFINGVFTITNKLVQENVTVTGIPVKVTYGDTGFTVEVKTTDGKELLGEVTLESSNDDVLSVDGLNVTVKNAGEATLIVVAKGNADYDDYTFRKTLTVEKRGIEITAKDVQKTALDEDPAFEYEITAGSLVNNDVLAGALTRQYGEITGTYQIYQGTLTAGDNYIISYVPATFTILGRDQIVTIDVPKVMVYGDTEGVVVTPDDDSNKYGYVTVVSLDEQIVVASNGYLAAKNVGDAKVKVTVAGNDYYNEWTQTADVKVTQRGITIKTENAEKYVGQEDPAFEYTISDGSLVYGDQLTGKLTRAAGEEAGIYEIELGTVTAGDNYSVKLIPATLTILAKLEQNFVINAPQVLVYGDEQAITVAPVGSVKENYQAEIVSLNEDVVEVVNGALVAKKVGTATVKATVSGNYKYEPWEDTVEVEVTKRGITIKTENVEKYVGQQDPEFEYVVSDGSLVYGDQLIGKLTRAAGEEAGIYEIELGTVTAGDNYSVKLIPATLTILAKLEQNFVINAPQVLVYGDEQAITVAPVGSVKENYQAEIVSLNEDVVDVVNGALVAKKVGTATIKATVSGNYKYEPWEDTVDVEVTKRSITIIAKDAVKRVDSKDPEFEWTLDGELAKGDELDVTLTRKAGEDLGDYTIKVEDYTLDNSDNYEVTVEDGKLSIIDKLIQENITVIGIPEKVTYGDYGFTVYVTTTDGRGLLGEVTLETSDDNVLSVNGLNVTVKNSGNATLTVVAKGNADYEDYKFTKKVTVEKRGIEITAKDAYKTALDEDPAFEYVITAGSLVNSDVFTGTLTRTEGENAGTYEIQLGTLSAGDNYEITFIPAKFTINFRAQNISVEAPESIVYGNTDVIDVTPVENQSVKDAKATFTSDNESVIAIEDGVLVAKSVGTAQITVTVAGDEVYEKFTKTVTVAVTKRPITITAKDVQKYEGQDDPAFEYEITSGSLVEGDSITGNVERVSGETVGKYDILIGTLAINNNYNITFNPGVFEILAKIAQTITVADVGEKTYGDEAFKLEVTPDEASKLDTFTYASSDDTVADVASDGTVTIKGAGEATITVSQAGNEMYELAEKTVKLVVNPITVTVTEIDMDNKTATIEGVLDADKSYVEFDFDKMKTTVISSEKSTVGETTIITSNLKLTNFTFKGEKAKNYVADKTAALTTTVATTTVAEKLTEDENVTIEAAPAGDKTIIVTDVTVAPEAEVKKVTIDVTAMADTKVNSVALPKTTVDTIVGIDAEAALEITLKDGSDENKDSTITLNAQALASIQTAGSTATTISIIVEKTEKEEMTTEQATKVDEVSTKTPVVYSLNIIDEAGNSVASSFGNLGKATVKLPYTKPAGNGYIIVKHLDDLGNLTDVFNPIYDAYANTITVELGHFSEYLIYTEPVVSTGGGGGGGGSKVYYVTFNTDSEQTEKVKVVAGKTVTKPNDPAKEGFTFGGWFTDAECTVEYDFSKKVLESFTLYAKWTENKTEDDGNEDDNKTEEKWTCPFSDVKEDDWFYSSVEYAVNNGLFNGMSDDEFAPGATLTRAMLVTILYRAEGEPEVAQKLSFNDVAEDAYYAKAVEWGKESGIINGIGEGEFAPDVNITREQIAAIMHRYAKYKGYDLSVGENTNILSYDDAESVSEYAIPAMQYVVGSGLIKGRTPTTINPKETATRAEAATILTRFFTEIVK